MFLKSIMLNETWINGKGYLAFSVLSYSMPSFWFGMIMILLLYYFLSSQQEVSVELCLKQIYGQKSL